MPGGQVNPLEDNPYAEGACHRVDGSQASPRSLMPEVASTLAVAHEASRMAEQFERMADAVERLAGAVELLSSAYQRPPSHPTYPAYPALRPWGS